MPTTYTHDLFGKKVYQKLTKEMKGIIRRHGDLYRIGLHGPDIFFYFLICKNPVTKYGVQMHDKKAREFFERAMEKVRETKDEALLAYLLGFGCHYLLDSACHPYVDEMHSKQVITHTLLEKEFDRALMEENGRNPLVYRPSDCIVPRYSYARVIHRAIPQIAVPFIYLSLPMMKASTNAMVCNDGGKRRAVLARLASLHSKNSAKFIEDHFMAPTVSEKSRKPVQRLRQLFDEALLETPGELAKLYALSKHAEPLSERWNKTYNG